MSQSLVWNAVLTTAGFTSGLAVVSTGIRSISSIVGSLASGIKTALNAVISTIQTVASTLITTLSNAFKVVGSVATGALSIITGSFSALTGIISSISGLITGVLSGAFNVIGSVASGAFEILSSAANIAYEIISAIAKISFTVLIAGIGAVTAAIGVGTKIAAEWEKGMAGIAKVTDIDKGTAAYNELSDALSDVWASGANAKEEVQAVAKTLGSMGVTEPKSLASATDSVLQVSSALDVGAEETATSLAKIMNLTPEFVESAGSLEEAFLRMGSGINELENKSTVNAQNIITGIVEAWPMGKLAGLSMAETAALTTVGQEVGMIPSEIGTMIRTAVSALNKESTATEIKGFDLVGDLFGMSRDEAQQWFSDDFPGAIAKTMDAVGELGLNEMQETDMLQSMFGAYGMKWIALKGQYGNLIEYQNLFSDSVKSGESVTKEYNRSIDNMIDQYNILKNTFSNLLKELGEMGLPSIMSIFPGIRDAIIDATAWVRQMKEEGYSLFEILVMGFEKVWDAVTTEGPKKIHEFVDKVINFLENYDWYSSGKWVADQIIKGINAISEISVDWSRLWNAMKSAAIDALTGIRVAIYNAFGTDIADAYDNFRQAVLDAFKNIIYGAVDMGVSIHTAVVDVANALIDMGNTAIGAFSTAASAAGMFVGALASVVGAIAGVVTSLENMGSYSIGGYSIGEILNASENPADFGHNIVTSALGGELPQEEPKIDNVYISGSGSVIMSGTENGKRFTESIASYGNVNGVAGFRVSDEQATAMQEKYGVQIADLVKQELEEEANSKYASNPIMHIQSVGGTTEYTYPGIERSRLNADEAVMTEYKAIAGEPITKTAQDAALIKELSGNEKIVIPDETALAQKQVTNAIDQAKYDAAFEAYDEQIKATESSTTITSANTEATHETSEGLYATQKKLEDVAKGLTDFSSQLETMDKLEKIEYDPEAERQKGYDIADGLYNKIDESWGEFPRNGLEILTPDTIAEYEANIKKAGWETGENAETISESSRMLANALTNTETAISKTANEVKNVAEEATEAATEAVTEAVKEASMYYGGGTYQGMGPDDGGYIGPSSGYREWAMKTNGYVPKVAMLGSINQQYASQDEYFAAMEGKEIEVSLAVDNTVAASTIDETITKATEPQTMPILGDTTDSWAAIDAVIGYGNSQEIWIPVYTYDAGGYMPDTDSYDWATPSPTGHTSVSAESVFGIPSHESGLSFVPFDNYMAKLHKGERILTAEENRRLTGLITITYSPMISIGANVAKEEMKNMIDEQLYAHSVNIEKMIVNKIKGNR